MIRVSIDYNAVLLGCGVALVAIQLVQRPLSRSSVYFATVGGTFIGIALVRYLT